jgi:hypothetical protein
MWSEKMNKNELTLTVFVAGYIKEHDLYTRYRIENTAIMHDKIVDDVPVALREWESGGAVTEEQLSVRIRAEMHKAITKYKHQLARIPGFITKLK